MAALSLKSDSGAAAAEDEFLDFACGGLRQLRDNGERGGNFEMRHVGAGEFFQFAIGE